MRNTHEITPITPEVLDRLDAVVPAATRVIAARDPMVHGVVRKGGSGEFTTVTVRLDHSDPLLLERRALERMAEQTRIPTGLLAELPDDLIRKTLNAQLHRHWSWFTHAVVQDDRILDWLAPGWEGLALMPSEVATTCAQAFGAQPCLAARPEGEWPRLRFFFTTPELHHVFSDSPRARDRHEFYVGTRLDLCGWELPTVHAVSYRLVCANGMMAPAAHPGSQRKFFAHTRTVFLEKLRSATVQAVGYIRTVLIPAIQGSITRSADVETVIAHLPDRIAELVRSAYQAEDLGGTEYHLVNALTRAANYPDCPADWRERLQKLAGELTVGRRCPRCFRSS